MIEIYDKSEWFRQPDYLQRLVEIISKSKQLEQVHINNCGLDGAKIEPIIAALQSSIQTMKKIDFWFANWNEKAAIEELVKFIATAPKLEECDIKY